ncbi:hypothetical protein RV12_GL001361 [Enterococcus quebecensis]|nr:hypothetical protein RV12_GL001361 [Enterococcus quebecensis]
MFLLFTIFLIFGQFLLQYKFAIWPKLYMGLAVLAFVMLLSFCRLSDKNKISRNAFILIAVMGILNAFIMPIRQNLDENTHYYHALEVADGKIRNQTNEKNFLMVSPDFLGVAKLPSKPEYKSLLNTNLYNQEFLQLEHIPSNYEKELLDVSGFNNPAYIPSALGIVAGRLISDKVAVSYYLGRIFNLLFYAFLVWAAVKTSRNYKLQIFVTAAIPYTLWISSGFTYDNLYYGLILLVLAQITNFLSGDKKVTFSNVVKYSFTCLGLVFCKAPTILLMLLPLFLQKNNYKSPREWLKAVCTIMSFLFLGFLWLVQNMLFKFFMPGSHSADQIIENTSSGGRLSYFINHPVYSVELILRGFSDVVVTIFESIQKPQPFFMQAGFLGFTNIIVFIVLFVLITLQVKFQVNKIFVRMLLAIFSIITLGIIYAITGDPRVFEVGDLHVSGVQGRYHFYMLGFVPLLLAPVIKKPHFAVNNLFSNFDENKTQLFVMKLVFIVTVLNSCVALYGYL